VYIGLNRHEPLHPQANARPGQGVLRYNDFLLLRGIPAAAYGYRLGNRSALEWVIDQYRVSTDPRSGIVNDPNRDDDPKYILRLIGQVITVSLETQKIIASLPSLNFTLGKSEQVLNIPSGAKAPLI
jgi:predicted helicase